MVVIGLVGRIGAGKSTVARMLADRGAEVLDADALAHEALADAAVREAVVARFGGGVLDAEGRVSRPALAERVFGPSPDHAAALAGLEAVVHPWVRRRIAARLAALRAAEAADGRRRVAVLDVPLLVQSGWDAGCDRLVVVECEDPVRLARLAARGWSPEQIAARERAWDRVGGPPPAPGKSTAVDASGDPAYTRTQIERFWVSLPAH
jgi:dephospho-CoA kinase